MHREYCGEHEDIVEAIADRDPHSARTPAWTDPLSACPSSLAIHPLLSAQSIDVDGQGPICSACGIDIVGLTGPSIR